MAVAKEDYYLGDDLEAILSAIEDNLLVEDEELSSQINSVVEEVRVNPPNSGYPCNLCDKVCKTQRGLTTHRNAKHKTANVEAYADQDNFEELYAKKRLHPLDFKTYTEESALKLSIDGCYSEHTRKEFADYKT